MIMKYCHYCGLVSRIRFVGRIIYGSFCFLICYYFIMVSFNDILDSSYRVIKQESSHPITHIPKVALELILFVNADCVSLL